MKLVKLVLRLEKSFTVVLKNLLDIASNNTC